MDYCEKCGESFFSHNDDGSCVSNEVVQDVSDDFPNAIKAERRDDETLILRRLDNPVKTLDGTEATLELENRWHRKGADVHSVQGNDFTFYAEEELDLDKSLFDQLNLF